MTDNELLLELEKRGYDISSLHKKYDTNTVEGWIKYLESLDDKTYFNKEIISNIYYVVGKGVKKGRYDFSNEDEYITEIKTEVKEIVTEFETLKAYFKIKRKKDIDTIDLEKYKL